MESTTEVDAVIGIDTHRDTHTAALTDALGRQLATLVVAADAEGYQQLLGWAAEQAPGPRVLWAVEGTRSHGAGLTRVLHQADAEIVEVDRPTRRARRNGKSDPIDALLAARSALANDIRRQPRADGAREAARLLLVERDRLVRHRTAVINQMRDLVLTAADPLRARLRSRSIAGLNSPVEVVGIEGTGSYGAGIAAMLSDHSVPVAEVNRPDRQLRRRHGKTDTVDAEAAARSVLSGLATGAAKSHDGIVESIRLHRLTLTTLRKSRTAVINTLR